MLVVVIRGSLCCCYCLVCIMLLIDVHHVVVLPCIHHVVLLFHVHCVVATFGIFKYHDNFLYNILISLALNICQNMPFKKN
jgi:hypothetical protein